TYVIRRTYPKPFSVELGTAVWEDSAGRTIHVPRNGELLCGDNPYVVARLAKVNLEQESDVVWEDDPRPVRRVARLP
ncbi:MAG: hypothetical protein LC808_15945, partial [Actinobacteria bacterium]|nr:hypothetical protein [Actinomycetota bacterium]